MKNLPLKRKRAHLFTSYTYCIGILVASSILLSAKAGAKSTYHADNKNQLLSSAESYVSSQFNDQNLMVKAKSLDSRIEVPPCESGYEFKASAESLRQANVTVKASCSNSNWYLYLVVHTRHMQSVVVLTQQLSPGSILTAANMHTVKLDKKRLRSSTYNNIQQLIGAKVKRRLRPGQPITPQMLCFVCTGDAVVIKAKLAGLEITTSGVAQQDGNIGQTIVVKNNNSKRMINALISSTNQVEVSI